MTPRRWSDVAIVALIATALIAAGVAVVAVVQATSENSPVQLVLETPTATPSGPTAVPWADLPPEPSPIPHPVALSPNKPTPTSIPTATEVPAPPCRASDLVVGKGGVEGGVQSGSTWYFVFSDISSERCSLNGFPEVVLLDSDGSPVPGRTQSVNCVNGCGAGGVLAPGRSKTSYAGAGDARISLHWPPSPPPFAPTPTPGQICDVLAVTAVVHLPEDGGEMSGPIKESGCTVVSVSPFQVYPVPPPPPPPPSTFAVHLVAPPTAIAGTTLKYYGVLTNVSPEEATFVDGHCPNFVQILTLTSPPGSDPHALNCGVVRSIMSGQSIAFAMEFPLNPNQTMPLLYDLTWSWHGTYSGSDRTSVEILPAPTPSP
jgi:Protein of unknown function (DUF4232)